jgi:hypothetical protein
MNGRIAVAVLAIAALLAALGLLDACAQLMLFLPELEIPAP